MIIKVCADELRCACLGRPLWSGEALEDWRRIPRKRSIGHVEGGELAYPKNSLSLICTGRISEPIGHHEMVCDFCVSVSCLSVADCASLLLQFIFLNKCRSFVKIRRLERSETRSDSAPYFPSLLNFHGQLLVLSPVILSRVLQLHLAEQHSPQQLDDQLESATGKR